MKYRKKPVEIEAIRFQNNHDEVNAWCQALEPSDLLWFRDGFALDWPGEVWDKLHNTWVRVKDGQWIIHGVQGEFYTCDAAVFEQTYEPATEGGNENG